MRPAAVAWCLVLASGAAGRAPAQQAGTDRLWQEVEALRASAVESLLVSGAPPDPRRGAPPGETPLLWVTSRACASRDPQARAAAAATALALVRHEADVNAVGETDLTPLLHAASACPPEVVVALMRAGADTRARTRGGASALALAMIDDRADNVRAMLDAGYDVARERGELNTYMSGKPEIQAMVRAVLVRTDPPEPAVWWQDLRVRARLDADGVLHVAETLSLSATGAVASVERDFRGWIGTETRVARLVRLDAAAREAAVLSPGPLDAADRYELPYGGLALRWSLRGANDAGFAPGTPLTYRSEYTVSGAVIPIWGVRAPAPATFLSPFFMDPRRRAAQLWEGWRLAPGAWTRRYLVDQDFSPFALNAGTALGHASLELAFDQAWGEANTIRREWRSLQAADALKEFLPLDNGGPAAPRAVPRVLHAAWLGSLVFFPAGGLALWGVLFAGRWLRRRRLDRVPMEAAWIELHVVSKDPGEIRTLIEGGDLFYPGAAAILERMAREGKIELPREPAGGTLRLRVPRDALTPCERAIVERLFGGGNEVDFDAAEGRAREGSLDLDGPGQRAFDVAQARSRRLDPRGFPTFALLALGVVAMLSLLSAGGFQALAAALVLGSFVYSLARPISARSSLSPELPLLPLALLLAPALVFAAALVLFFLGVPAHPWALAGLAALWLGLFNSLLNAARPAWPPAETDARYDLARARRYIAAELERPLPALEDRWLPWILALGLQDEVEAWRRRKPPEGYVATDASPGTLVGRWSGGTLGAPRQPTWAARLAGGAEPARNG